MPVNTDKLERGREFGRVLGRSWGAGGHSTTYQAEMGKEDFQWHFALLSVTLPCNFLKGYNKDLNYYSIIFIYSSIPLIYTDKGNFLRFIVEARKSSFTEVTEEKQIQKGNHIPAQLLVLSLGTLTVKQAFTAWPESPTIMYNIENMFRVCSQPTDELGLNCWKQETCLFTWQLFPIANHGVV